MGPAEDLPVRWQMKKHGNWTTTRLARTVNTHRIYLGGVINGRRKASAGLRARIAEAIGLPEDQLFGADYDSRFAQSRREATP